MKSKDEVKEFYEKFSKTLIRDKIYPNSRHYKIKSYLRNIFFENQIEKVLEIGCGIGILSEYISKKGKKVTSIDISEENIKFAKSTVKNVEFHAGDFLEFSFNDKYDLITLFDVLEHIPKEKYSIVFKKIKELSNENSLIVITIPDAQFLNYTREHRPEILQVVDESIYFNELKNIIDEKNLEILKYEKYGIDYDNQYRFFLLGNKKMSYKPEINLILKERKMKKVFRKIIRVKLLQEKLNTVNILKINYQS